MEPYNGPLLEGVQPERLVEIRWDHVVDNRQVAIELGETGWNIVDPIEFPVAKHQVRLLAEALFRPAREVPEPDREAVASHFSPPRIKIHVRERLEGGAIRDHELQVGALDADGMQVEVLVNGRYLRALRNLDDAFSVSVHDLRERRIFDLSPERVVQVERSGFSDITGSMQDLAFVASREGPTWQQSAPLRTQLDPSAMSVWVRQLCALYASGFSSDVVDPELSQFGLNMPNCVLKFTDASGAEQSLLLAQNGASQWFGKLADDYHVYSIDTQPLLLALDDWSVLRDTKFLRAHRADIGSIELASSQGLLRLTQGPALDDDWTVAFRAKGQRDFGPEWLVEKARIQEFLGMVEQSEVTGWLPLDEQRATDLFGPGNDFARYTFRFRHTFEGEHATGFVGPVHTSDLGTSLRTFAREVGLVDRALAPPADQLALEHPGLEGVLSVAVERSWGSYRVT
ncbi:MAG: DUF4340 domain-containing protein, partial [Planctomycetes bacterium]|nr:DUF4340 domain-containing protein [Planctomycetota bacterium]